MGLKLLIPPALEPVTLDETAPHCRDIDPADFPTLLRQITAARTWVENRTGRALVNQTWLWSLPVSRCCPVPAQFYNQWNWNRGSPRNRLANDWYTLFLYRPPLQSLPASPTSTCKAPRRCWTERLQDRRHHATRPGPAGLRPVLAVQPRGDRRGKRDLPGRLRQPGHRRRARLAGGRKPSTAYTMGSG